MATILKRWAKTVLVSDELQRVRGGVQESKPPAQQGNTLLQKVLKTKCDDSSAARGPLCKPLRKDNLMEAGRVMIEFQGKIKRQTSGDTLVRRTGSQEVEDTTITAEAPSSNSSWAQFYELDQGLNVQFSSTCQLWRKECDRLPGELSQVKVGACTACPASRHMPRLRQRYTLPNRIGESPIPLEQRFGHRELTSNQQAAFQGGPRDLSDQKSMTKEPKTSPNTAPDNLGAGPGLGTELGSKLEAEDGSDSRSGLESRLGLGLGLELEPGLGSGKETGSGPGSGPGLETHTDSGGAKEEEAAAKIDVKGPKKNEKEGADVLGGDVEAAEVKDEESAEKEAKQEPQAVPKEKSTPPTSLLLAKKGGVKKGAPPPPAPDLFLKKRDSGVQRQPQVVSMFHEVERASLQYQQRAANGRQLRSGSKGGGDPASLLAEIKSKSPYAEAVRKDAISYEKVIKDLATEIATVEISSMSHLLEFVHSTDSILDELSDETAVLKHFQWPKRYDVFREAGALFEEMNGLRIKLRGWERVPARSLHEEFIAMQKYTDKCIERVYNVLKDIDTDERRFREAGIPWSGKAIEEVKHASLCLMERYMSLCLEEVERIESRERYRGRADLKCFNLLRETIRFAFRVHQFAGGFTQVCTTLFAEVSAKTRALTKRDSPEEEDKTIQQAEGSQTTQES